MKPEPSLPFNPVEIIRKKRDGHSLTEKEIHYFIDAATKNLIPEYQVSALLMAIYFQKMNFKETALLTQAMIQSGKKVTFTDSRPKVDKH
jgi:pyrimidine-nucleoside phosphorylase